MGHTAVINIVENVSRFCRVTSTVCCVYHQVGGHTFGVFSMCGDDAKSIW